MADPIRFQDPWRELTAAEAVEVERLIAVGIGAEHAAHGGTFTPIATRIDCQHLVCAVAGYQWRYAIVFLASGAAADQSSPMMVRLNTRQDLERRLAADRTEYLECDVDLDLPDDLAEVFEAMPAECELACCGLGCIAWDEQVYAQRRTAEMDARLVDWLRRALVRIAEAGPVRYVNCRRHQIVGGEAGQVSALFQRILDTARPP